MTHWVIVSVGIFTSFLFEPAFEVVDLERGRVNALGSWGNAVTATTPADIGRITTEIVLQAPEILDEVIHVAGDTITYGELADAVEESLGRPIERHVRSVSSLNEALSDAPHDQMRRYRAVFATGPGMSWKKEDTFNFRNGIATTDVKSWLETHLRGISETAS